MNTQDQPKVVNLLGESSRSNRKEKFKNFEYSITRHMSFNLD